MSHANVKLQVGVEDHAVTDWYTFMRDLCSWDLVRNPVQLGSPGHTVAINESVVAKAKPGNGCARPVRQQWVFGTVDIGTGTSWSWSTP